MPDTLTVAIVPETGRVTFEALEDAVSNLRRLIRDVDRAVTRDVTTKSRQWFVERLSSSYPTITLSPSPLPGQLPSTSQAIVNGIRHIAADSGGPPEFFSEQELEDLLRLRHTFNKGINRFDLSSNGGTPIAISPDTTARVERILRQAIEAWGSLEGDIEAIDVHRNPRFTVWERLSGQAVRCYFPPDDLNRIKNLLRRTVRVSGLITYFADGRPRSMKNIVEITDITSSGTLRPFWASIRDFTNGLDSVEYLMRAAGEQ